MKLGKITALCLAFLIICPISAKKNEKKESSLKTDECILMKEICDEALDFQSEYDSMPDGDEKKEMLQALNSYILHCEKARKDCSKSVK